MESDDLLVYMLMLDNERAVLSVEGLFAPPECRVLSECGVWLLLIIERRVSV